MSTFKAAILKGSGHEKSDGTTNIKIRITHRRRTDYIPTDLYIEPDRFDTKSGTVKSGKNKSYINLRITEKIQKFQKKDIELGEASDLMTVKQVKSYLLEDKLNSGQLDFFEFAEDYLKTIHTEGTLRWHNPTLAKLKSFAGEKLSFAEINLLFLQRFEQFLKRDGVKSGINNYMRSFRSLFNKARDRFNDEDTGNIKIPHYPFRKYKMPKSESKSKKHFLTVEELKMFINYKPAHSGEQFAKDMFLLMFYLIGIEAKDLFYLHKSVNGRIIYDRFKTGKDFSIKIEPEAGQILNKYAGTKSVLNVGEKYKDHLNFIKFVNDKLHGNTSRKVKGIFPKLGIDKPVTTKWARHSWATIARNNCRINKDDVALCLGHQDADNKVTDIYIDYDYSIIDESNRKVLDLLK